MSEADQTDECEQWTKNGQLTLTNKVEIKDQDRTVIYKSSGWFGLRGKSIVTSGVRTFKIKINKMGGNGHDGIMIGVCNYNHTGVNYTSGNGYMLYSHNGSRYHKGTSINYARTLNINDVVEIRVDMDKKEVSFKVNNKDYGVAYNNLPNQVRLAIDLYYNNDSATIIG
ncbi:spry domain containing socs box protein [Anaeramoeba flamelloides]|uniref:Spry domain containing socs box protein n=1 Tax=Anaeramoeba flamelloides TaxID=1746091 RepID=A0ABQ8Y4F0_9EUKA|nr:spry domain containing socs box protein [Anaeramoeba flamelloides]